MATKHPSMCRNCTAYCPIVVTVEDGRPVKVEGDPDASAFEGYICPKGRELPAQHNHPSRILRPLKRQRNDTFSPVSSDQAIRDVSERLRQLIHEHGPNSVAVYFGTGNVTNPNGAVIAKALMNAIGSKMLFSATTIDKPAANISLAMHGGWVAGAQSFETADTWMIVGANPVIAKSNGAPFNNPGKRIKEALARGLNLIVIDPRRTETAKRARIHIQPRPGEDAAILAGIIRVIVAERLYDSAFVAQNAVGFEALSDAVSSFTPEYVAGRAGISADEIVAAARLFASGQRGGVICSTGPSFATNSNLTFYLGLCLNTICGRWARAGEPSPYLNVLLPPAVPKAQPYAPFDTIGAFVLHASGLRENASGMPTAALADEILSTDERRVRALICFSGNPATAWPDQLRTEAALKRLELLVVLDHQMTETASLAHYVVPCPLSLETAGATTRIEALKYIGAARGYTFPWAHYSPKVVDSPEGSDLVEDGAFFFRIGQQMGLSLKWSNVYGFGKHLEWPTQVIDLDMEHVPTTDEMIELTCRQSRIPLSTVKRYPHGHVFDEQRTMVQPRDPTCTAMLQLGEPAMMEALASLIEAPGEPPRSDFAFTMISRRINDVMNSVGHSIPSLNKNRTFPPAFLHPSDMHALGLTNGDSVLVLSRHSEIVATAQPDATLRRGLIALVHGFSSKIVTESGVVSGAAASLIDLSEADRVTGIPRMSAIPVSVRKFAIQDGQATNDI